VATTQVTSAGSSRRARAFVNAHAFDAARPVQLVQQQLGDQEAAKGLPMIDTLILGVG